MNKFEKIILYPSFLNHQQNNNKENYYCYYYLNQSLTPSRGSDTIDTQDKVICNENMNYVKIQNKEEELENKQDK